MERIQDGIGVWFTSLELWAIWNLSQKRIEYHGGQGRPRKDGSQFNEIDDYLGLKAEYAFQKVFLPYSGQESNGIFSLGEDPGQDFSLGKFTVDVKYMYPSLIFNDISAVKADIIVVVHPFLKSTAWRERLEDPYLDKGVYNSRDVVLAGWIGRKEFLEKHKEKDFGYGPKLFVEPDILNDIYRLFNAKK